MNINDLKNLQNSIKCAIDTKKYNIRDFIRKTQNDILINHINTDTDESNINDDDDNIRDLQQKNLDLKLNSIKEDNNEKMMNLILKKENTFLKNEIGLNELLSTQSKDEISNLKRKNEELEGKIYKNLEETLLYSKLKMDYDELKKQFDNLTNNLK